MSTDYIDSRTCWLSSPDATEVDLQLWALGVNHPPVDSGPSMRSLVLKPLYERMVADWAGPSQILALTGVRYTAFPDDAPSCGAFDDCFSGWPLPFTGHAPPSYWGDNSLWCLLFPGTCKDQREFSAMTTPRWKVMRTQIYVLSPPYKGYNPGLFRVVLQDTCKPEVLFSLFITHLADEDPNGVQEAQMSNVLATVLASASRDELAPVLLGDFNAVNPARGDWWDRLKGSFDEMDGSDSPWACHAGVGAGSTPIANNTMKIFIGRKRPGSAFVRTLGEFLAVRQSGVTTSDGGVDATGYRIDGISHILVGIGLKEAIK